MFRRTKIVATLGPASSSKALLKSMLSAHVDVVRVNFSHGDVESQKARCKNVRSVAEEVGREIAILADMQGPKIRLSSFENGSIELAADQPFILDPSIAANMGDVSAVGIDYPELYQDVHAGDTLLIGDGEMRFSVERVDGSVIHCRNQVAGVIYDHKGINRQGGGLSAGAITEKDKQDIRHAVEMGADFIALSFVRSAEDIATCRTLIQEAGGACAIVAKIERVEALQAADAIIDAADAIMVARGDLAVEIGVAEVPGVQKNLIKVAREKAKPVIIATQMMESMIHSPVPTRAEVSDVANAVLDGADAVMLSAETAVGNHPLAVVETVATVCMSAEKHSNAHMRPMKSRPFDSIEQAIALSSMHVARHLAIKAVIALTESGKTPLWMSRIRSGIPIFAMSRHSVVRRKVMLYRDVYPIDFDVTATPYGMVNHHAVQQLENLGFVHKGDMVLLTKGDYMGGNQGANAIKILTVGNVRTIEG